MKINCLFLFLLLSKLLSAQETSIYADIDQKMSLIPVEATRSTSRIAQYISENFNSQEDQLRAAFYWTASSISYDVENMFNIPKNLTSKEKIETALSSRKGVCMHYAEVFASIANQLAIPTVLIEGYTKNNGKVDTQSHVWCAAKIDNKWSLYDPTWASGYVNDEKYYKKQNDFYYKTDPKQLILNHMPFDFMWQLLEFPINNQEFYDGKTTSSNTTAPFDFNTEIILFDKLQNKERCVALLERIKKSGVKNHMITERCELLEKEIEAHNQNEKGVAFMAIVENMNNTSKQFNAFVKYRNNRFIPAVSDVELKSKTQNLVTLINQCERDVNALTNVSRDNIQNVNSLKKAIAELKKLIIEQDTFVGSYLSKSIEERPKMFVKTVVKQR
jgi:hypothetical protein